MIVTSFGIGLIYGFIFFEMTGLTAGGIIVPGYLALFIREPLQIVATLLVGSLAYLTIQQLSRFCILFGRRRFLSLILTGFILRMSLDYLGAHSAIVSSDLQAIGYVIPGLIANEFYRQGILKTLISMIIVSSLVFFTLKILY